MLRVRAALLLLSFFVSVVQCAEALADSPTRAVSIPAGDLGTALEALAKQSGADLVYRPDQVRGLRTQGVKGQLTTEDAVRELLRGTSLRINQDPSGALLISSPDVATGKTSSAAPAKSATLRLADAPAGVAAEGAVAADESVRVETPELAQPQEVQVAKIPQILVRGSKLLNMDIERTRDDIQPYVVFNREKIAQSGASNIDELLKTRLPMNTVQGSKSQLVGGINGNTSSINLRGLGSGQTLILVDGHRMAGVYRNGSFEQPDINGIPITAIERIEVLPSTASGIYGGGATGGVINIILRRDYSATNLSLTYDNSFATDSAQRRVNFASGFTLEHGRTNVMLSASYSDANPILVKDRDFNLRARRLLVANNPDSFEARAPMSYTPTIASQDGSSLVLKNGTALNSSFTHVPIGYAGVATDGGMALVGNAGKIDLDLPAGLAGGDGFLLNTPTVKFFSGSVRREFTENVQAFLDVSKTSNEGRWSYASVGANTSTFLEPSAPDNPFTTAIFVGYPSPGLPDTTSVARNDALRAVGGVIVRLPHEWHVEADLTYNDSKWNRLNDATAYDFSSFSAFSSGAVDVVRDLNKYPIDYGPLVNHEVLEAGPLHTYLKEGTVRFSGPIGSLPAGPLTFSGAIADRRESTDDGFIRQTINGSPLFKLLFPKRSLTAKSVYLETRVPLVAPSQGVAGVQLLEAQISGRHEENRIRGVTNAVDAEDTGESVQHGNDEFDSTDYTLGFRYVPLQDLTLRASFGTGTLPPGIDQLAPTIPQLALSFGATDPLRGNTEIPDQILTASGGNPNLKPEESKSWSAGLVLTPRVLPGLRMSLDYTHIVKTNEIFWPSLEVMLQHPAAFPGRITRGANLPGDASGWAGPITFIDSSLANSLRSKMEAFDLQLDYGWSTPRWGRFDFFMIGTRQTHLARQSLPEEPLIEQVGYSGGPLEYRANAGLTWRLADLTVGWTAHYFDSYKVYYADSDAQSSASLILNQGSDSIPSQIYHDVFATYRFTHGAGSGTGSWSHLRGESTEITLGARNVFNKEPPIIAGAAFTTNAYSEYADPRLATYYLTVRHSF